LSGRLETISTLGKSLAARSRSGLRVRGNCIIVPFMGYLVSGNFGLLLLRAGEFYLAWAAGLARMPKGN
jgi:hypothetical protein